MIRARASDSERQTIEAAAAGAGMATGAWLIRLGVTVATGGSWRPQQVTEAAGETRAAWVQLRRVGANLNQLARVLNATGQVAELGLLVDTMAQVQASSVVVEQAVAELMGQVRAGQTA